MTTQNSNLPQLFLGLDHGTSAVKGLLVTESLEVIKEFAPLTVETRQIDTVSFEQNPLQHLAHAQRLIADALRFANNNNFSLSAVGLSVQRSGVTAWHGTTGAVLHPLIIWRDTRTQSLIDSLSKEQKAEISATTSLPILPYYAAGKYAFLQQHFLDTETLVGGLDSFLINQLCQGRPFQTEKSMAARTMLYDLAAGDWSQRLCEIFSVSLPRLPRVRPSIARIAALNDRGGANQPPLLCASLGDQQAALFACQQDESQIVLNLGTIASLLVPTKQLLVQEPGYISSVFYSDAAATHYILEGISHASGPVIDFIQREFAVEASEIDAICRNASNSDVTWFWSAGGYATPLWNQTESSRCTSPAASNAEKVKALVENIGGFIAEMIIALESRGVIGKNQQILCTGGLSELDYLLEFIATITEFKLAKIDTKNAGAFGAAIAALHGLNSNGAKPHQSAAPLSIEFSPSSQAKLAFSRWTRLRDELLAA